MDDIIDIDLDTRLAYVAKRLNLAVVAAMDRALAGHGLTTAQFAALTELARGGAMSGADLARHLAVTPQSAATLADRLEQRGLIERDARAGSRREIDITISATGMQAWRSAAHDIQQLEDALTERVGAETVLRLVEDATVLRRALAEPTP